MSMKDGDQHYGYMQQEMLPASTADGLDWAAASRQGQVAGTNAGRIPSTKQLIFLMY